MRAYCAALEARLSEAKLQAQLIQAINSCETYIACVQVPSITLAVFATIRTQAQVQQEASALLLALLDVAPRRWKAATLPVVAMTTVGYLHGRLR